MATYTDPPTPAPEEPNPARRRFLVRLSLGLGALGSMLVGVPIVGTLVAPLLNKPPARWRPVGPVDQYAVGTTTEVVIEDSSPLPWAGVTAKTGAWLRRDSDQSFIAFALDCSHLGCPVRWLPQARLFMCPCHGGVYYEDGEVAAGPPPDPLTRYPVRVRNGQVEIQAQPLPIT